MDDSDLGTMFANYTGPTTDLADSESDPKVLTRAGGSFRLALSDVELCVIGFQGLRHDPATGTIDNRARVYLPDLERFASKDPLGYVDGMNTHVPYHVLRGGVDPSGMNRARDLRDGVANWFADKADAVVPGSGRPMRQAVAMNRRAEDVVESIATPVIKEGIDHIKGHAAATKANPVKAYVSSQAGATTGVADIFGDMLATGMDPHAQIQDISGIIDLGNHVFTGAPIGSSRCGQISNMPSPYPSPRAIMDDFQLRRDNWLITTLNLDPRSYGFGQFYGPIVFEIGLSAVPMTWGTKIAWVRFIPKLLRCAKAKPKVPSAPTPVRPGVGNGLAPNGVQHSIPDNRARHMFTDKEGHIPDTPENRKLLQGVADDPATTLGTDKHGNVWSAQTQADGTQVWTQSRGGNITNGGVNQPPKTFHPDTGLSSPVIPNKNKK